MGRSRAAPWKGTERTWAWLIQVEEEGRRGEGREHARAVGSDAAADEDVPGAKEDPRRGVERGVEWHHRTGRSRTDPPRRPRAAIPERNREPTDGNHRSPGALLRQCGERSKPHPRR